MDSLVCSQQGFWAGGLPATIVPTDHKISTTDTATPSFASCDFGTEAPDRQIGIVIGGYNGAAGPRSGSGLTIGGVAATKLHYTNGTNMVSEIWIAAVPTGASGTVAQTWDGGVQRTDLTVFAIYGGASSAADIGGSASSPITDTIDVPAGGVAFGGATTQGTTGPRTHTVSGLTEYAASDETVEGNTAHVGFCDAFAAAQSGLSVTVTPSNTTGDQAMVMVSLAPA